MIRILLTGGGTGGHVYPLCAVAKSLRKEAAKGELEIELHYMGYVGDYRAAFEEAQIDVHPIAAGKVRRYASLLNLLDVPKFFIGLIQAWWKLYFLMPDAIFSKGGTGSFPVVLAGWFYRIPIVIHESDTVPGLNNLFSSKFAARVAVSFDSALRYFNPKKCILTGAPLRDEFTGGSESQTAAKELLGFDPNAPLVFVTGGSQGSERLNDLMILTLGTLIQDAQILHQTGIANYLETNKLAQAALLGAPQKRPVPLRYLAVPYFEKPHSNYTMQTAMAAADLVVSRAGSNSIFEIAACGKPAILIPLHESANDHQRANAYAFAEKGGATVIEEPNLLPDIFITQVRGILSNPEKRATMAAASRAFFKPNAAETIAEEILNLAK